MIKMKLMNFNCKKLIVRKRGGKLDANNLQSEFFFQFKLILGTLRGAISQINLEIFQATSEIRALLS